MSDTRLTYAERINILHHEAKKHRGQALLKAKSAGELLREVKQNLKHGEYLDWLRTHFNGSPPRAWQYTRIANRWEVIAPHNSLANSLSISEALKIARYGDS